MKTVFPKQEVHISKWFIVDAKEKTLGRLATQVSTLLNSKQYSYYTPGINQGNYVIVINSSHIKITGHKSTQKIYYKNSQRPGSLKKETYTFLKNRIPNRIIEKAVWGMLPKNVLGRNYFKKLYIYKTSNLLLH
jgi:large subunit ribosomal protein L13